MAERKPNEQKIIAWHMVAKNVIKFANDEQSYKCNDKVLAANDFAKYPLSKGTSVEVGINENVITFLRKQKSDAQKSQGNGSEEAYEPTPEEEKGTVEPEKAKEPAPAEANPPLVDGAYRELTVFAVAANKKVVKFTEIKDAGWFQIAEAIQAQDYKVIGLEAKNKANVLITENTVMSFAKVASEATEQPKTATSSPVNAKVEPTAAPAVQTSTQAPKKEWKPASSYDTAEKQTSIEAQSSINAACDVVGRVAASISPAPTASIINSMIRAVAESNYSHLKELKSK